MRTKTFLPYLPYAAAAVVNLIADLAHLDALARYSQWALMPLLILAVLLTITPLRSPVTAWLVLALLFSWGGDVLLGVSFVFGLGSFLLAHVSFIVAFTRRAIRHRNPSWTWRHAMPFVALYLALLSLLVTHVGAMLPAVMLYGLALCTMAAVAAYTSRLLGVGGLVFIVSDGLLAIHLFRPDLALPQSGFWVMLTYTAAEALIAIGLTRTVRRTPSAVPVALQDAQATS
ncbi:lysoplasmalogenase [Gryllotalpicola protaetiae]|uniref:Lysoplasmalogenase n=1 Tax=Gryllotalpicola protaetiae TaxID=2419771 RepID=A0A387BK40_9MICO|nr:lysoplasmalogenase [Gryllotalpicola protaetiae]AYG04515.1 lysoplasmalogenase [Gryllotalpicola protaetiae]